MASRRKNDPSELPAPLPEGVELRVPVLPPADPENATEEFPAVTPGSPQRQGIEVRIAKKYDPDTGGPRCVLAFLFEIGGGAQELAFTVPMAEQIAQGILKVCAEHRDRFDSRWFDGSASAETG